MFSLQTYKSEKNIKPLFFMRNSTFRKFLLFLLLLPTFLCTTAWAQLSELKQGKVYRFVNVGQSSYALAATTTKGATGSTATTGSTQADYPQLWCVTEVKDNSGTKTYRLRNMGNGLYLQGNEMSKQWKMVNGETTDNTYLYLITRGTHNTLSDRNNTAPYRHMHLDGSKNVVGWLTSSESTQWDITEVNIDANVIAQNWTSLENVNFSDTQITNYQTALDDIFTDKACTTLRSSYASMSETALTADANYTALPPILQNMVMKTWRAANGTPVSQAWAEANFDNSKPEWGGNYAKRFRIQNYEIYTERDCAHSALKINIHTNLNNPTGIFGNYRQPLFIMVDQDVPANASLYLGSYSGHGQGAGYNDGVQLHKGLNIIPFWGDKTWTCIYYTAKTMKAWDGTTTLTDFDLTQFPDLKIHIEGGNVNGYYNAVGDDLWAHDAATTGCDENHNVTSLRTNLTKANGSTTETNDNLIQENKVYPKGDNEADWDYLAARNVLDDLTIVSRYMVFQFCFNSPDSDHPEYCTDYWFTKHDDTRRVRIPDVLERWDRIMMSQRLTMGLLSKQEVEEANARFHAWDADKQDIYTFPGEGDDITKDYSKHYRMHGLAISMNEGYMSGGWTSSNYNYGTLPSIIGADMTNERKAGSVWGPAHEIGHQHQKPINMNGLTEVTNNMFANIAVWYDGRSTSRMNGGEGDLSSVLNAYERENYDFFSNNIWAQTHLYYKLWLYYHLTGKNKNFLPRLFELLRRDPMEISYNQEGKKSLLHFYKKACEAAGEDLTEFFRAYGFFTVMNKRFVGDYAHSEYTQTQEDINEAIQYVKAKKYHENLQVLFINDATPGKTYLRHDGTTARTQWDGTYYSDLGAYTDYQDPAAGAVVGTYQMTVENGKAILSGATGGAGFLLYDEAGNLLAFSNDKTFPLTDATMLAISSGKASVKVMDVAGVTQEVSYDSESAAASLLKSALNQALPVLNHVDEGGDTKKNFTKVGFFKGHTVENLRNVYTKARTIYDNRQTVSYITAAQSLKKAIEEVLAREDARVAFIPGSTCTLRCFEFPTRYMTDVTKTVNNEEKNIASTKIVTAESNLTDAEHWIIESNGEKGHYKLKNKSTGRYISTIAQSIKATTGATAKDFVLTEIQTALWGFNGGDYQWIHCAESSAFDIVGWNADEDASKWYIVMTEKDEALVAENDLQNLISRTRTLVDEVAQVGMRGDMDMANMRIYSNTPEQYHGTEMLVDGNAETYFHTNWMGNDAVNEDHYLLFDCDAMPLEEFAVRYTTLPTSASNVDAPKTIVVEGANEAVNGIPKSYTTIATLSSSDATNPLPTAKAMSYTSATLGTAGTSYRYIRLRVTDATGGTWGTHKYFGLAELTLVRQAYKMFGIESKYTNNVTEANITDALTAITAAETAIAAADKTTSTLQVAYTALEAKYNVLATAKANSETSDNTNPADKAELNTVLFSTQTRYANCFSDAECTAIKSEYASSLNVTASFLAEVKAAIDAAQLVAQNAKATQTEVDEQTSLLRAKANQLTHAIAAANFPVKLTFNTAQPELYSITMKVADGSRLQYRGDSSHGDGGYYDYDKIKRANHLEKGNAYQAFYFVPGSEAGRVRLYNYADNKFFGATDYTAGPGKLYAKSDGTTGLKVEEWTLVANENNAGWYNLKAVPTDGSSKVLYMGQDDDANRANLGFRGDADNVRALYQFQQDNGMNLSDAYIQLYNYFHTALKHNRQLELNYASDALGFYPKGKATAFNNAFAAAETALANESSADEVYTTAYNNLVAANTALEPNLPEAGKYYVVRSAATNNNATYCQNALIYADKDIHRMKWGTDKTKIDATAIWTFERQDDGTFLMKNLHTATGPGSLTGSDATTPLQENSLPVTIASFDYTLGNLTLSIGGKNAHAQESGKYIMSWEAKAGNASLWTLEELTESELGAVGYTLSMSTWENASFYSAYPVSIPNGLKAYYLQGDEALDLDANSEGTAKLTEITRVIPAGTGVILRGAKGSYTLPFAADAWTNEAPAGNLLKGSPYKCFKPGVAGTSYYVFGVKNGNVGLYKAYLEYDANGTQGENNAYNDTNRGGCFLVEANRIYMERTGTQNLAAGFRLLDPEQTGISLTELDAETETVYDLQGRRVLRVKTPGFYLINGQKRFVRP